MLWAFGRLLLGKIHMVNQPADIGQVDLVVDVSINITVFLRSTAQLS